MKFHNELLTDDLENESIKNEKLKQKLNQLTKKLKKNSSPSKED